MRKPSNPRRGLRLVVAGSLVLSAVIAAAIGCGPYDVNNIWVCLNPVTGYEDPNVGDPSHYVNGTFDPCHCYDPCGESKECPIPVDAGPPKPGCDAGSGSGAGGGASGDGGL